MTRKAHPLFNEEFFAARRAGVTLEEYMTAYSEHVTLANADSSTDGKKWRANSGWQKFAGAEDFHSSDRVRQLMEVGYWGTLDVESVS